MDNSMGGFGSQEIQNVQANNQPTTQTTQEVVNADKVAEVVTPEANGSQDQQKGELIGDIIERQAKEDMVAKQEQELLEQIQQELKATKTVETKVEEVKEEPKVEPAKVEEIKQEVVKETEKEIEKQDITEKQKDRIRKLIQEKDAEIVKQKTLVSQLNVEVAQYKELSEKLQRENVELKNGAIQGDDVVRYFANLRSDHLNNKEDDSIKNKIADFSVKQAAISYGIPHVDLVKAINGVLNSKSANTNAMATNISNAGSGGVVRENNNPLFKTKKRSLNPALMM